MKCTRCGEDFDSPIPKISNPNGQTSEIACKEMCPDCNSIICTAVLRDSTNYRLKTFGSKSYISYSGRESYEYPVRKDCRYFRETDYCSRDRYPNGDFTVASCRACVRFVNSKAFLVSRLIRIMSTSYWFIRFRRRIYNAIGL